MDFIKRLKNLWVISKYEPVDGDDSRVPFFKRKEMAVFIMPDRVQEILEKRPNASLQDVIKN